jgi:NADPH:quinone reductase-like Zn-dependent oxidoreductase
MKAVVYDEYGPPDVLQLRDVERPVPKDDEVLIRVHASSINDWDWGLLHGTPFINRLPFGIRKPQFPILGSDVAGRVEEVGRRALRFQPGDDVYGDLTVCRWGCFAEYVCAREVALVRKPSTMTFVEAAALPQAGLLALQAIEKARLGAGQRVLINGAGGGAGTIALQIAKSIGAHTTGVDSGGKLDTLRSLGAEHVIDYTREDFTKSGQLYDVIFDVKTNRSVFDYVGSLAPHGTYITVGGSLPRVFQTLLMGPWISLTRRKNALVLALAANRGLDRLQALFETRQVSPVIDGPYPLAEVPEAFRRFGKSEHKGKIVIAVT